jgi:hypothetical protein
MRVDTSRVFPPYLCYALNSDLVASQLARMARGAIMEGLINPSITNVDGNKTHKTCFSFGDPSFCAPAFGVVYVTDDKIAMVADSRGELDTVNDFGSLSSSVLAR